MKRITVLHVLTGFSGESPLFNQVIQGLDTTTYRHIVCYLSGPVPPDTDLRKAGFDVRELPYTRKDTHIFRFGIVRFLREIIKNEGVAIIHAHRRKPTNYALMAVMGIKGVKIISTIHGTNISRTFTRKLVNRLLWPRLDKIVGVTEAVRQDILTCNAWFPLDRTAVINNGINIDTYARPGISRAASRKLFGFPANDCWLWGSVGYLRYEKGHDILLNAWTLGRFGKIGGRLAIAGSGELLSDLKESAKKLKISGEVQFLGKVRDIPKFLAGLDGFVFPSRREGFGLALVEAMAAGLPVVASATGGISEILEGLHKDGRAILVPPEQPEALAEAMSKVMGWNTLHLKASKEAHQKRAITFDTKFMLEETDRLYKKLSDIPQEHFKISGSP